MKSGNVFNMEVNPSRHQAPPVPTESWWIGVDRESWPAVVASRQPQLSSSPMGRKGSLILGVVTVDAEAETRWRRSRQALLTDENRRAVVA